MSDKLLIFITGYLLLLYYYIWYIYVFFYFQNASLRYNLLFLAASLLKRFFYGKVQKGILQKTF